MHSLFCRDSSRLQDGIYPRNEHLGYLLPLPYIILASFPAGPMHAHIEGFGEGTALAGRALYPQRNPEWSEPTAMRIVYPP
jgi:hypothetical protein